MGVTFGRCGGGMGRGKIHFRYIRLVGSVMRDPYTRISSLWELLGTQSKDGVVRRGRAVPTYKPIGPRSMV